MPMEHLAQENIARRRMAEEEDVRRRVDKEGAKWIKVYFGGGAHYRNWLDQAIELNGKQNVKVEEIDSIGLHCYEESGEKMYRIWVRENDEYKE